MKVRLKTTFADLEDFRIKIVKFPCQAKIRIFHIFHFFIYLYDDTKCIYGMMLVWLVGIGLILTGAGTRTTIN